MSRITLFALASLAALVAVAAVASAEYYEGKPECPPDRYCTMSDPETSDPDEGEFEGEGDESPACEECATPPERDDGDASDDCWTTEEGGYVCKRTADEPVDYGCDAAEGANASAEDCAAYSGPADAGCDAPTSSMDAPDATADECPSLGAGADDGAPEPVREAGPVTDVVQRDAPAGALVGALAALGLVAVLRRR